MSRKINILLDGEDIGAKNAVEALEDALEDLSLEAVETSGEVAASATGYEVAEESVESLEDSVDELDEGMGGLAVSAGGLDAALNNIDGYDDEVREELGVDEFEIAADELDEVIAAVDKKNISVSGNNVEIDVDSMRDAVDERFETAFDDVADDATLRIPFDQFESREFDGGVLAPDAQFFEVEEESGELEESIKDVGEESEESAQKITGSLEEVVEPLEEISGKLDNISENLDDVNNSLDDISDGFDDFGDDFDRREKHLDSMADSVQKIAMHSQEMEDFSVVGDEKVSPISALEEGSVGEKRPFEDTVENIRKRTPRPLSEEDDIENVTERVPRLISEELNKVTKKLPRQISEERENIKKATEPILSVSKAIDATKAPMTRQEILEERMDNIREASLSSSAARRSSLEDVAATPSFKVDDELREEVEELKEAQRRVSTGRTLPPTPAKLGIADDDLFPERLEERGVVGAVANLNEEMAEADIPETYARKLSHTGETSEELRRKLENLRAAMKVRTDTNDFFTSRRQDIEDGSPYDDFQRASRVTGVESVLQEAGIKEEQGELTKRAQKAVTKIRQLKNIAENIDGVSPEEFIEDKVLDFATETRSDEGVSGVFDEEKYSDITSPFKTPTRATKRRGIGIEDTMLDFDALAEAQLSRADTALVTLENAREKALQLREDVDQALALPEEEPEETSLVPRDTALKVPSPEPRDVNMGDAKSAVQSMRDLHAEQKNLAGVTRRTTEAIDFEGQTFLGAAQNASNLAEMKQAASQSNEILAKAAGKTQHAVESESKELVNLTANAKDTRQALSKVADSELRSSAAAQYALDNFDDLNEEQRNNFVAAMMSAAGNKQVKRELDDVEDKAEEASDEVSQLTRDLAAGALAAELFSGEFGSLSLNLGAVNIALRNMTRQVPMLITTLGTLVSVVGGLASASVAAGTGVAGIFGAGAIAQAQQFKENVAGVTNLSEGFQAIGANMKQLFMDAAAPLIEAQGVAEFFRNTMEGAADEVNFLARSIKAMMPQLLSFANTIGNVIDEQFNEFVIAMADSFLELRGQIESMLTFLIEAIPGIVRFFTEITEIVGPELGVFIKQFISFAKDLIRLGAAIQAGLLPAVTEFVEVLENMVEHINSIGKDNISALVQGIGALLIANKVAAVMASFTQVTVGLGGTIVDTARSFRNASGAVKEFGVITSTTLEFLKGALLQLSGISSLVNVLTEVIFGLATGINLTEDELNELQEESTDTAVSLANLAKAMDSVEDQELEEKLGDVRRELIRNAIQADDTAEEIADLRNELIALDGVDPDIDIDSDGPSLGRGVKGKAGSSILSGGVMGMMVRGVGGIGLASLGGIKATLSSVVVGIVGVIGVMALLVGVLGNFDKVTSGLSEGLNAIVDALKGMGSYLVEKLVPIWNHMVDIFELFAVVARELSAGQGGGGIGLLIDIIVVIFDMIFGFVETLVGSLAVLAKFLQNNELAMRALEISLLGPLALYGGDANNQLDSGLKIDSEDVEEGAGKASKSAEELLPSSDRGTAEFNNTTISQNYGDINADPEEKEQMKRLVKEAMMEANTYRRQDDGFSG